MAQNWKDLSGQRGLSTSDQRHVLSANAQYTTGMGLGGKTLMSGWKGLAYKEWTVSTTIRYASGLPETPIVGGAMVAGAANLGTIRANYVGGPVHLNSAGSVSECGGVCGAGGGPVGNCAERLDHRAKPAQPECDDATDVPAEQAVEFIHPDRCHECTQPRCVFRLEHDGRQPAVWRAAAGTNGMRTMQITMRLRY